MADMILSNRALSRATLARQLLLRRDEHLDPVAAVRHVAGLQAQTPHTWYVGLWSRLAGVRAADVSAALQDRRLVRIALLRSTIHLVTADDAVAIRPLVAPVLERSLLGNFGRPLAGIDREALADAGRTAVEQHPRTFAELGRELHIRWPDRDPSALAQGVRCWVPLVQVPPRALWGRSGPTAHTTLDAWLGDPDPPPPLTLPELIRRYLSAYGPASPADAQAWSGLPRLGEVFEVLRPELVTFRSSHGVELFDLPEAPRPGPDTPAPVRLLYDYDNLLLSYADRSRIVTSAFRASNDSRNGQVRALLVDGRTAGSWTVDGPVLTVRTLDRVDAATAAAIGTEGTSLLDYLGTPGEVRVVTG